MAQKSIRNNPELARRMKQRRYELNLTIEETAARAGVGTKTWSRYEAGESIRSDKCKGICRALRWNEFPCEEEEGTGEALLAEYKGKEGWSEFLAKDYGPGAALAFAVGSELLLDKIEQDLADLAAMPAGSHIGQVDTSFLKDDLPPQFLTKYDYEFFYHMRCVLLQLRQEAEAGLSMTAHSVFEELVLFLCDQEAKALLELSAAELREEELEGVEHWVFELFADRDIVTFLYSNRYLKKEDTYHFVHWNDRQFFITEKEE